MEKKNVKKSLLKNNFIMKLLLYIYDASIVFGCSYAAIKIVELNEAGEYMHDVLMYSLIVFAMTIILFTVLRLYSSLWKYAGVEEFVRLSIAILAIFVVNMFVSIFSGILSGKGIRYIPIRWCLVFSMLQMLATAMVRFIYRLGRYFIGHNILSHSTKEDGKERIMIVGAGDAGVALIKELRNSNHKTTTPICLIDDNSAKLNMYVEGLKVVGNRHDIPRLVCYHHIDRIIIAIPSISNQELAKIIFICQDTKCKVQAIPGIYQFISGNGILSKVRDIDVEDLLGRDPIIVDSEEITKYLKNQVVLVTGGGGSIGSELCRQIAKSKPKQLIIVEYYENNAYDIEQELKSEYPELNLLTLIASVRDVVKIDDIFQKYQPNIVYHAAAHKHVPLMETSPNEAVKNNVFGTLNVVKASDKYGVKRFIMISSDKAVNPTNIMGATKRICEMIIQAMAKRSKTEFVATRFGNVLGSNGSVIPLFKKQIERGGPVTVTDKNIVRYFMTIPEAVSLVLQAGSYAKGGEIFVLDMGKPVKIYDLAVNLIKLSGYTPDIDIQIKITGLRPGEKLYEEMLLDEEGLASTPNKLIYIGKPIDFDEKELFSTLDDLYVETSKESVNIKELVQKLVKNYSIHH